ncbi:glucan endo-1,3-beta-glucosidase A1-like [Paramacrobiotus metropolitanus]|uniref:glucan endo-1,3-beta-glucosidase A1-like n=1 Tax=Paramacrobiotus metropolitanus TaxID=2943436 RepID=UPI00244640DF|nr:glucan endo-1,3-beta-glucosidase A1-like [Paramacrobiotus metropolitanus]
MNVASHQSAGDVQGCSYTSGLVDTRDKFSFTYGEIEWRALAPVGRGIQPQLWLQNPQCGTGITCKLDDPPAFHPQVDRDQETSHNISAMSVKMVAREPDVSREFHVYKIGWFPDGLQWSADGVVLHSVICRPYVPTVALQGVLNVAVGGFFSDSPNNGDRFPIEFLIDYVVVRQKPHRSYRY